MSLTRKIVLSIYLVALMVVSISLGDDLLWVKIVLVLPFLVALFWPAREEKTSDHS